MHGCLYLNNDGSRWVYRNGPGVHVKVRFPDGHLERRKVIYWYGFGNFAGCVVSVKGKKRRYLPYSTDVDGAAICLVSQEDLQ